MKRVDSLSSSGRNSIYVIVSNDELKLARHHQPPLKSPRPRRCPSVLSAMGVPCKVGQGWVSNGTITV